MRLDDFPWLAAPPDDWSARCRNVRSGDATAEAELRALAQFRLDANRSLSLARALQRARSAGDPFGSLTPFKLGILSGNTFDLILDCVPAAGLRHGVAFELVRTAYGSVFQTALDPRSVLYGAGLDAVLVAVDHRFLGLDATAIDEAEWASVDDAVRRMEALIVALAGHGGPPAILQTLAAPPAALFGSFDAVLPGTLRSRIARFNGELVALARRHGAYVLDIEGLAAQIGADRWFNPLQWAAYKLPFDASFGPIYAEWLGRLVAAIRGKSAKCLVLDLDNTLWGGVIGDDGPDGIVIGQGSPRGEAHLAVQRAALDLRSRGILLAVASKNEPTLAVAPFRDHPDMLLREEHISVFQANWIDKASNLEAIAKALNIGVDALVLLDDNPAERAQIRQSLPSVRVPELPEEPGWFAWILQAAGYFEAVTYAREDAERARMLAQDAPRAAILAQSRDLEDYLQSLDMVASFAPFDAPSRQRVTQLINKTNQFNLQTKRYTESQVAAFEADPLVETIQVRLADRFGDLGMIAVAILDRPADDPRTWTFDTWLMSCRVFGREVETATLAVIARAAAARGVSRLIGRYRPTAKNAVVADLFERLGFACLERTDDGGSAWTLELESYREPMLPLRIVDHVSAKEPTGGRPTEAR
jgi:FkbH-like protein